VADVEALLPYHLTLRLAKQFMVAQQVAGDGIFDSYHTEDTRIGCHRVELRLERLARNNLDFTILEILAGCHLVVTTLLALNGHT
jgi:hypothetical protein